LSILFKLECKLEFVEDVVIQEILTVLWISSEKVALKFQLLDHP